jgi:anti-anti-sigma factor
MSEASAVVTVERLPSAVVFHVLPDELRKSEVDAICAAVDAEQATTPTPTLPFILNLSKVAFMGSLAMGTLMGLNTEFRTRGQRLIFASLQPNVDRSIRASRMNKLMEIAPDLDAAKKSATA